MSTTLPSFETERLLLRPPEMKDAPSMQASFADYAIISELAHHVPWPYPDNGAEEFIKKILLEQGNNRWVWGIFQKSNLDELIGCVDLWRPGKPDHRGFWLAKKAWGQGLMTEAVAPVTHFAFFELGFEKLIFSNALGNTRSRRIKEKAEARLLETREGKFVNPHYTQREIWELTKERYLAIHAPPKFKIIQPTQTQNKDFTRDNFEQKL